MDSLFRHLGQGLALALLRPGSHDAWRATVGALVALMTVSVGLTVLTDWVQLEPKPARFNPLALREVAWDLPALLLVGWLASGALSRNGARTADRVWPLLTPIALIAAWTVSQIIAYPLLALIEFNYPGDAGVTWAQQAARLFIVWQVVIAFVLFRRVIGLGRTSSFVLTIPIAALIGWSQIAPPTRFWYADATELAGSAAARDSVVREDIIELQSTLVHEQLQAIEPHRPGVVDLYFIGFAPYAGQSVFSRELAVIHPLMDQRFDTAGRSIRLVNHDSTLREHPLATVSNLRRAIAAIARKIDLEEDILMIYLNSHGSKNHQLTVDYAPLELYGLDPGLLKDLLDEAGVRNRVVIVSACYSGAFVAALAGERTLVMTAADAHRASFGCSDDSEFTYFGRALFDEQLRTTWSLPQAFEAARPVIRERERRLDPQAEHSNPQMALGAVIARRLEQFEARLKSQAGQATSEPAALAAPEPGSGSPQSSRPAPSPNESSTGRVADVAQAPDS